jgi:glycine reductase
MRVVHYLNQFFGGIGGEEAAGSAGQVREGAVGPGRLLEQVLGADATVVRTVIAGDNHAAENLDSLTSLVLKTVREVGAELFVAGPCFDAGRYGVAAGALCAAVQSELLIPAVTGMAPENPGVDLYRRQLYIVDSGESVAGMREALVRIVAIARKLLSGAQIGPPSDEGYIPRGIMRAAFVEQTAAQRLVGMIEAKTRGLPFESEFAATSFPPVPAPPPVRDLSRARVAIVSDGGVVPRGNPDKLERTASTKWGAYDISGVDNLRGEDYEVNHGGYDTRYVADDPDRMVPLDAMRDLERSGAIGSVYDHFISWSGQGNPLANSRRLGREIAARLKEDQVDAVILVSA